MPHRTSSSRSGPQRRAKPPSAQKADARGNEGEGSRSAARQYDRAAERFAADPEKVDRLAEDARHALNGPEGKDLRTAESKGKAASHR